MVCERRLLRPCRCRYGVGQPMRRPRAIQRYSEFKIRSGLPESVGYPRGTLRYHPLVGEKINEGEIEMKSRASIVLSSIVATCVVTDAVAQSATSDRDEGALAEVIITATKSGATDLQKTPLAVTAFSADQLNNELALNVKDIAPFTPN